MAEFKLSGRKIKNFRCHIDPSIGPKPLNAFPCDGVKYEAEICPVGVFAKHLPTGQEFLVPFANIQRIELAPEETTKK